MARSARTIAVLPGDGIGPEVIRAAVSLLEGVAEGSGEHFSLAELPFGGRAIDRCGAALPDETLAACRAADAVLLGAVGGPLWDPLPLAQRPESGLLALRKELDLYINVRPTRLWESLRDISALKASCAEKIDFEIVRELAGGIYFGEHRLESKNGTEQAMDVEQYTASEVERVARFAFQRAQGRRKHLTSVDKANVLATSVLWRRCVAELAGEFPGVAVLHMDVDNAAMQLVLAPQQFDVLVTSNLFGDILNDGAAGLVGSIGMIPSMSCGTGTPVFELIHGSAPGLAGKDSACPVGAILCVSMMLREAFGYREEALGIESAVGRVLARGYRTPDIARAGDSVVGCSRFAGLVRQELRESLKQMECYGWGV